MRKTSMFQNDDLLGCDTAPKEGKIVSIKKWLIDNGNDEDLAEKLAVKKATSGAPRKRYAPLKDGTFAIAKIVLTKKQVKVNYLDPETFEEKTRIDMVPDLRESKGARWIDARFVLEGRYANRWIPHRFMLSGASKSTRQLVSETKDNLVCINAGAGYDMKRPLSACDGQRVPILIGQHERHGDGKLANFVRHILCAHPIHPTHGLYEEFAKKRKVAMMPDPDRPIMDGKKIVGYVQRRWIDFPGWHLYPHSSLYGVLVNRIHTFDAKAQKSTQRALKKMEK